MARGSAGGESGPCQRVSGRRSSLGRRSRASARGDDMGMRRTLILTLTFGALAMATGAIGATAAHAAAPSPAPKPAELPRGQLVERVACAEHPEQTYALYLPQGYTRERKWPILYAF